MRSFLEKDFHDFFIYTFSDTFKYPVK